MEKNRAIHNENRISTSEYRYRLRRNAIQTLQDEKMFEIIKFLGEGSYGAVIAVNSPRCDQTVAAKIVLPDDTSFGEMTQWPALHHKNILPLLEIIELPSANVFITPKLFKDMETILEGEEFLKDPNGLLVAKIWLKDVLNGLNYIHGQKLCHLDLKADNVLIGYDFKAVICDFTFICSSVEPVYSYGGPIPYRPPETCLAMENYIFVDGKKFDMWTFGILALNVFTNHFLKGRLNSECKKWHRDIYPILYEGMQSTYFRHLMNYAFQTSNVEVEFPDAFNFVQFLLREKPEDRPTVRQALNHAFFRDRCTRIDKPDDMWLFKVQRECSCVQLEKPLVLKKDYFENYKWWNDPKRFEPHRKIKLVWRKAPTIMISEKQVIDFISELFKTLDFISIEQNEEKILDAKTNEPLDSKIKNNTSDILAVSPAIVKDIYCKIECDKNTSEIISPAGEEDRKAQKYSQDGSKESDCEISDQDIISNFKKNVEMVPENLENLPLTEEASGVESEEDRKVEEMEVNSAVTLSGCTGIAKEELPKEDMISWFEEEIDFCVSSVISNMMKSKNVKDEASK